MLTLRFEHRLAPRNALAGRLLILLLLLAFSAWESTVPGAAWTSALPRCDWSNQVYDDFYTPSDLGELKPERLGEVLRVEHIRSYTPEEVANAADLPTSPYGAKVYRVLYLSQAPIGTPRAVSGLIVVPTGTVPEQGFAVIAHGHGTRGLADNCAPSKYALNVGSLLPLVAHGFMVSATDYAGLGTPGLHPYAVGESEAYSLLDGARAALRFCDNAHGIDTPPAANLVFFEGYSQGGHAALFAHQIWESYAPELGFAGTVALAPGSEPRLLTQQIAAGSSPLVTPAVMVMYAYNDYYENPIDLQSWLKEPYATEIATRIEQQCLLGLTLWIGTDPERVFQPELISAVAEGRWDELQPMTNYLDENAPGNFASENPVLIVQGEDDQYVPPEATERLKSRLCLHGTPVKLSSYEGVGHSDIPRVAQPEALQWIADRLAGLPAPDSCLGSVIHLFVPAIWR